jgi:hypothetical protein
MIDAPMLAKPIDKLNKGRAFVTNSPLTVTMADFPGSAHVNPGKES